MEPQTKSRSLETDGRSYPGSGWHGSTIDAKGQWIMRIRNTAIMLISLGLIWQLAAWHYNSTLMLPSPLETMRALGKTLIEPDVWINLLITMKRILFGFAIAVAVGVPLGLMMGFSRNVMQILEPFINAIRQIPIMAWVPLTIVWFGLGDGPTIFLIAFTGTFPVLLNTIAGVQGISRDYYHAARSMGATTGSIIARIVIPGSLPDVLTGMRLALSSGWMSVI